MIADDLCCKNKQRGWKIPRTDKGSMNIQGGCLLNIIRTELRNLFTCRKSYHNSKYLTSRVTSRQPVWNIKTSRPQSGLNSYWPPWRERQKTIYAGCALKTKMTTFQPDKYVLTSRHNINCDNVNTISIRTGGGVKINTWTQGRINGTEKKNRACSSCNTLHLHLVSTRRKTNTSTIPWLHFIVAFLKQLMHWKTNATFCTGSTCLPSTNCLVSTTVNFCSRPFSCQRVFILGSHNSSRRKKKIIILIQLCSDLIFSWQQKLSHFFFFRSSAAGNQVPYPLTQRMKEQQCATWFRTGNPGASRMNIVCMTSFVLQTLSTYEMYRRDDLYSQQNEFGRKI